jgi:predicted alpha/beta-fold hydrolase
MPVIPSEFRPAWWLPGAHLQTLWPTFFRVRPPLDLEPERLELPDGDFLDLAWSGPREGPMVLVLHGLEGTLKSHYAAGILDALNRHGYRACFMHFRSCSGQPNRLPRSYHSGDTGDLRHVVTHLVELCGQPLQAVIGFSLGGNVLLKWLGECGTGAPVRFAVAVSVPFMLDDAARRLNRGLSRIYQRHLVRLLHAKFRQKFAVLPCPLDVQLGRLESFHAFDDRVTAPLHGFAGVEDYYARSSSRQFLAAIRTPTLILHAADDPFMFPETVPHAGELSAQVTLELAEHGGHAGFVQGPWPWRADYWLDRRILSWLESQTQTDADTAANPMPTAATGAAQVSR